MAFFRSFFLAVAVLAATVVAAHADKRVALVIGNSAYKNVNRLKNPANDAAAIVAVFKAAGFDSVDLRQDLNVVDMRRALREFETRMLTEAYNVPLLWWQRIVVMRSNVKGWGMTPSHLIGQDLETVWLKP